MEFKVFPACAGCALANSGQRIGQVTKVGKLVETPQRPIVLFIGEAPGKQEVLVGDVFVGASGELLKKLIDEYKLTSHAVITNAILCAPSDHVRKQSQWYLYPAVKCGDVLHSYIMEISPDIIVCLGKGAVQQLLKKRKDVAINRKFSLNILTREDGTVRTKSVTVFYTHHPAAVLHNPTQRLLSVLRACFAAVKEEVERMKAQYFGRNDITFLFENIEHKIVTSNYNEHLEQFLAFLASQQNVDAEGKKAKCRVVIDLEVGCPQSVDDFDSKSPASSVVLVGIGDAQNYAAYAFYWVGEDLRPEPIADPRSFTALRDMLLNPRYFKIFHNASFEIMWFLRLFGIYPPPEQFVDTMCLAHSINETSSSFSLENLVREYLVGEPLQQWKKIMTNPNACYVPTKTLAAYNQGDIIMTYKLYMALKKKIQSLGQHFAEMHTVFQFQVFNKIGIIVAHMTEAGIPVSLDSVSEVLSQLIKEEMECFRRLREVAPTVQNFNSRQQVVRFLLELGVNELLEYKTPKGEISLSKEVIDQLCERRPDVQFLQDLKAYREIQKCRSTFVEKVEKWVDKKSGRIHPNIHVTGTISGRITTSNPPLQNFPSEKKEIGKIIRKIFVPPEGYVFITCDAKQHELRILAIKSGDEQLRNAFLSGEDVHKVNAARILRKPIEEITEEERQIGKKFSFAVIYGVTKEGAARIFNISEEEAEQLLNAMYSAFPAAVEFIERHRKRVLYPPYTVHTWLGRVSHVVAQGLPNTGRVLDRTNPRVERLMRVAGNYIIQSEASDLWCLVAYEIFVEFHKRGWTQWRDGNPPIANLCLTIHDSIILLCKEEVVNEVLDIIKLAIAKVSYKFDTADLPITAEYAIYKKSLGDAPDVEGEWSVAEIQAVIKSIPPTEKKFRLFKDV